MSGAFFRQVRHRIAALLNRHPRAARAAIWAVLGGVVLLLAWPAMDWLARLGLDAEWRAGPLEIELLNIIYGLFYSGALGSAMLLAGHSGAWRAAGFALLAMFWFNLGINVGNNLYLVRWNISPYFLVFLVWFAGFLAATACVVLAAFLTLPVLRSRRAIGWLAGAGAGFALLAGAVLAPADISFFTIEQTLLFAVAAWGAVQAAAFAMALPPPQTKESGG